MKARPRSGNQCFTVFDDIQFLYNVMPHKSSTTLTTWYPIQIEILSVQIIGTVNKQLNHEDKQKEFTTYNILVQCKYIEKQKALEKSHLINRRFNEFKVLHSLLNDSRLEFPSSSLFSSLNKLSNELIQDRQIKLNDYLQQLLQYYDNTNRIVLHFLGVEYLQVADSSALQWKLDLELQALQEFENKNYTIQQQQLFYETHFANCDSIRMQLEFVRSSRDVQFNIVYQNKPCKLFLNYKQCKISIMNSNGTATIFFIFQIKSVCTIQNSFSKHGKSNECFEAISIQFINSNKNIWIFCGDRLELAETINAHLKRWNKNMQQLQYYINNYLLSFKQTLFDSSNFLHENLLLQYWNTVMPDEKLVQRKSDQWSKIGFQGSDPATDFRSFGILGLKVLLYFALHYNKQLRQIVIRLQKEDGKNYYPFSVSGINVFCMLYQLLQSNEQVMNYVNCLYGNCKLENEQKSVVEELFVVLCLVLDQKWQEKNATYMDYPFILQETKKWFLDLVANTSEMLLLTELVKSVL